MSEMDNTQRVAPKPQPSPAVGRRNFFSGFMNAGSRAMPRPGGGGSGGMGQIIGGVVLLVAVIMLGGGGLTAGASDLVQSLVVWGAVGAALIFIVRYIMDAAYEGDLHLFTLRIALPIVGFFVVGAIGIGVVANSATNISGVVGNFPLVQNLGAAAGGLVSLTGNAVTAAGRVALGAGQAGVATVNVDTPVVADLLADWSGALGSYRQGATVSTPLFGSSAPAAAVPLAQPPTATAESDRGGVFFAPAPAVPTIAATPISPLLKRASGAHDRYTVQPGDTMSGIAAKVLGSGSRYPELCAANVQRVGPGCSLKSGTEIIVPTDIQAYQRPAGNIRQAVQRIAPTAVPSVRRSSVPVAQPVSTQKVYTIAAGDSMFKIANKTGGDLYRICVANVAVLGGNCDQLTVGATIVIP